MAAIYFTIIYFNLFYLVSGTISRASTTWPFLAPLLPTSRNFSPPEAHPVLTEC